MKLYTRDDNSQVLVACAQFVNHPMPAETPDDLAVVPSTGQDLRVANCQLVFSPCNSPYLKEHKNVKLHPGWELLFSYATGFTRSYGVQDEQDKDHHTRSLQLSSHFAKKPSDISPSTLDTSSEVLTKVRVQQEAFDLKQLADLARLDGMRDCPSELARNPLISMAYYQWILASLAWKKGDRSEPCPVKPLSVKTKEPSVKANRPATSAEEEYAWSCFKANLIQLSRQHGVKGLAAVRARCSKYLERCPLRRVDNLRETSPPGEIQLISQEDLETWHMFSLPLDERPQPVLEYRTLPMGEEDTEPDPFKAEDSKRSSHP